MLFKSLIFCINPLYFKNLLSITVFKLEDASIGVTATTVRVPVMRGHCESVYLETEKKCTAAQAREVINQFPGSKVVDDPSQNLYPLAKMCAGNDITYVGRIREDLYTENGLNLWLASDNLRKGAALNAIQIAEELVNQGLV